MEKVSFKDSFEIMVLLGSVCKGENFLDRKKATLGSEVAAASAVLCLLLRTDVCLLLMFIYSSVWYKNFLMF